MIDQPASLINNLTIQDNHNKTNNRITTIRFIPSVQNLIAEKLNLETEEIKVENIFKGSFNEIFQFRSQTKNYALRIKKNELGFVFEQVAKEPFAALAFKYFNDSDHELGDKFRLTFCQRFCDYIDHPIVGTVYYSDWSKKNESLPYIFSIYEWKKGKLLYSVPTSENFKIAGKFLSRIHQRRFSSFYPNIFDIGKTNCSLQSIILSNVMKQYKKSIANGGIKALLDEIIRWIKINVTKLSEKDEAVFCHYDFSGSNLIIDEEQSNVCALDFDNWKVGIREDDFPKLLHWTVIDSETGKRKYSSERFEDFMQGYRSEGGSLNEQRLRLKEAEWLLQVYAHSLFQETSNPEEYQQSSFPSSSYYEQAIRSILYSL
jgi:aminoglycoside phosphotransferase (APT) family kinase protein